MAPQAKTEALIAAVQTILEEYRVYGPMTVRQIFYRLVGTIAYPKTEQAYKSLAETCSKPDAPGSFPSRIFVTTATR